MASRGSPRSRALEPAIIFVNLRRSVEAARRGRDDSTANPPRPAQARKAGGRKIPAAGRDGTPAELSGLTKTDLVMLAGKLGVTGRSSMRRDEVERVVTAARRPARRAS